jgi:hypothetical protein
VKLVDVGQLSEALSAAAGENYPVANSLRGSPLVVCADPRFGDLTSDIAHLIAAQTGLAVDLVGERLAENTRAKLGDEVKISVLRGFLNFRVESLIKDASLSGDGLKNLALVIEPGYDLQGVYRLGALAAFQVYLLGQRLEVAPILISPVGNFRINSLVDLVGFLDRLCANVTELPATKDQCDCIIDRAIGPTSVLITPAALSRSDFHRLSERCARLNGPELNAGDSILVGRREWLQGYQVDRPRSGVLGVVDRLMGAGSDEERISAVLYLAGPTLCDDLDVVVLRHCEESNLGAWSLATEERIERVFGDRVKVGGLSDSVELVGAKYFEPVKRGMLLPRLFLEAVNHGRLESFLTGYSEWLGVVNHLLSLPATRSMVGSDQALGAAFSIILDSLRKLTSSIGLKRAS